MTETASVLAASRPGVTDSDRDVADVRTNRFLRLILGTAVVLRLIVAVVMGDAVDPLPGIFDQISYDTLARSVLAGHGFTFPTQWWPAAAAGEPTAHWSYLYTLYLTGVYSLFGPHPVAARLIQAVITGLLGPWLAYLIGRRLFGVRAGLIGAGLTAVYAYFVYYGAALITESFYIVAVLAALYLSLTLVEAPSRSRLALLGLAIGLAALLRQLILLFVPFLLLWLLWAGRGRIRLRHLAIPILVAAFLILPWTAHNYRTFHRFVLLNTNAGFAFFWANHPIYGANFVGILPDEGPSYQELIPRELAGLDEAALDGALLRRGIGFVLDDPGRYAMLSLSRVREYFKFWPSPDSGLTSNLARLLSFGLLLPFMVYGLVLSLRDWRRYSLAYLFVGIYTAVHLLSWTLIRYRLPVDAVLIPFAGLALQRLAATSTHTARCDSL